MRLAVFYRHVAFRRLSVGTLWHAASAQGEQVLVGLLVYQLTDSTGWVGVAYALSFLPMLLVGLPAGLSADRYDRRLMLPLVEAVSFLILGSMAIIALLDGLTLTVVLASIFAMGCIRALHHPVRLSYAHDLLGGTKLAGALGALSVMGRIGMLFGALMAGTVMEFADAASAYALLAMTHLLALSALVRLQPIEDAAHREPQALGSAIREYLHELRTNPVMWRLTLIASAVEIFGFSFATALPELASDHLEVGAQGLGLLHAGRAVGGLSAGLVIAWYGSLHRTGWLFLVVIAGFGIALLALGAAPTLILAMCAVGAVAACAAGCDVLVQTMLQQCVADHLRGRAMGAWVLALGAGPVGHLQVGALAGAIGAGLTLSVNGVVMIALALVAAAAAPAVRKM